MHEMSLAESVREIAEEIARANRARRVRGIHLRIGRLAGVDPAALGFGLEVALRGGVTDGAAVHLQHVPGEAWCWDCAARVEVDSDPPSCPACRSLRLQVTGGQELKVSEVELADIEGEATCA
ncbi:MAG: hydrogenase maturation nickel metallochaperone HypA [Steroidobacteraceae bacterium]|jgi:hydrogenase nickel incorporation protein HypA/HybF|nr:hydrogenase maturation nickel metallochaperone HypA [Steroidobacteraceae bacterium]